MRRVTPFFIDGKLQSMVDDEICEIFTEKVLAAFSQGAIRDHQWAHRAGSRGHEPNLYDNRERQIPAFGRLLLREDPNLAVRLQRGEAASPRNCLEVIDVGLFVP